MDNADALGSSTAPLTWHDFLERMRQPSASDFVKAIKSFIVSFMNNTPDPERDSASVQEFLTNMEAAFRAHSLWAGCSEEELDSAGEVSFTKDGKKLIHMVYPKAHKFIDKSTIIKGLEKYVMTKLYTRVFASLPDDVKVDEQLHEKMALIQQFIRPENLDILPTYQNETSWLLAQKELQKINMYKAPRDKLACILKCCKVINNLLLDASIAAKENPPGADEFLPVLIYVTIKANPPQLHSNLLYIQRYRRQSRLVSEAAYFYTNMLSAESFVLNIDGKSLSMDEAEFERNMEFGRALLSGLSSDHDDTPSQSDHSLGHISRSESIESKHRTSNYKKYLGTTSVSSQSSSQPYEAKHGNEGHYSKDQVSLNKVSSISDLENRGAIMLMKEEKVSQVFRDFPYLYSQSGDLTVSDVDNLLNNYKQLVFKYVSLATGLGVAATTPSLPLPGGEQTHAETVKEFEDTRAVVLNNETHVETGGVNDDSNGVPVSGSENPESKLAQEEDASQAEDEQDEKSNS